MHYVRGATIPDNAHVRKLLHSVCMYHLYYSYIYIIIHFALCFDLTLLICLWFAGLMHAIPWHMKYTLLTNKHLHDIVHFKNTVYIYTVYTWRFRCLCPELRTYKISPVPWQFAGGLWSLSYIDRKPYEVTTNVVRFYRILTDSATNGRGDLADDKIKS